LSKFYAPVPVCVASQATVLMLVRLPVPQKLRI